MFTESTHAGGFIISEANGNRSRDNVTVKSGEDLAAGTVVGKITATGKYVAYDSGNGDGSETPAGIVIDAVDATGGDTEAAIIARDAEVIGDELVFKVQSPMDDVEDIRATFKGLHILIR